MFGFIIGLIAFLITIPIRATGLATLGLMKGVEAEASVTQGLEAIGKGDGGSVIKKKGAVIANMNTFQKIRYKALCMTYKACRAVVNMLMFIGKLLSSLSVVMAVVLVMIILVLVSTCASIVGVLSADADGIIVGSNLSGLTSSESSSSMPNSAGVDALCACAYKVAKATHDAGWTYNMSVEKLVPISIEGFGEIDVKKWEIKYQDCSTVVSLIICTYLNTYVDKYKQNNEWHRTNSGGLRHWDYTKDAGLKAIHVNGNADAKSKVQKGDILIHEGSHTQFLYDITEDGQYIWVNGGGDDSLRDSYLLEPDPWSGDAWDYILRLE